MSAPGLAPTAVVHHGMASLSRWPSSGAVLPVTVDRSKPERLVVHWDQVETGRHQAQSAAQALAEQLRAGAPPEQAWAQPAMPQPSIPQQFVTQSSVPQPATAPPPVIASAADILQHGTAGLASVVAVFPSAEIAQKPQHTMVGLQLNVMVQGQPANEVTNLYGVPNAKLDAVFAGATLPIKAVLSTPGLVAIDWDAIGG